MKLLIKDLFALFLIWSPIFCVAEEVSADINLGSRLSDCSVFFGVLSPGQSQFSEGMKVFSLAANSYLTCAISDPGQVQEQSKKSLAALRTEWSMLQNDKEAFSRKYEGCMDPLKNGEQTLRPRMDELTKTLVPEIFKQKAV